MSGKLRSTVMILGLVLAFMMLVPASDAGDLQLIGHGLWVSKSGPPNQVWNDEISMWLDIQVPNWSYDKYVGIVWTDDAWKTHHFAQAWYEGSLGNNYERWGIDIEPIGVLGNSYIGPAAWNGRSLLGPEYRRAEIEYAIFYILPNGYSIWDNNNGQNYKLLIASRG